MDGYAMDTNECMCWFGRLPCVRQCRLRDVLFSAHYPPRKLFLKFDEPREEAKSDNKNEWHTPELIDVHHGFRNDNERLII